MKNWDSHQRALRAARQLTASVGRTGVQWVAGLALLVGCGESAAGAGPGDATTTGDVAALLDAIVGGDAASTPGVTADADEATELGSLPGSDVAGSDGEPTEDAVAATDDAVDDAGVVDDAGGVDVAGGDWDAADTGAADTAATDLDAASTVSCLQRTDLACSTPEDCVVADKGAMVCVDGNCHEQDFTPNAAAQECCNAQYAAGNYSAPGCTPWGPAAPPADRGYRLADFVRELA